MIRDLAETHGRARDSVKLMVGRCVIVGETEAEAQKKYKEYLSYASPEGAFALFGGWTGIDLSGLDYDEKLGNFDSDGMKFLASWFNSDDPEQQATLQDVADYMSIGSLATVIVGTAAQVADELEELVDVGGVDGFNLIPVAQPESAHELVDLLIPELQRRGRFRTKYETSTAREMFMGPGQRRLEASHPALRIK